MTSFSSKVKAHVRMASPLVGFGIRVALTLNALPPVFKRVLSKLPVFGGVLVLAESFMALHGEESYEEPGFTCQHSSQVGNQQFDLIVVGSGPGGAMAVDQLQPDKRFLVLERGRPINPHTSHHSVDQMMESFLSGGQEIIFGPRMIPFSQGSAFGGGSAINSGLYHRLPSSVRKEWLELLGMSEAQWRSAEERIEALLAIETQSVENLGVYFRSPLKSGAENGGLECAVVPRWRNYSSDSDYEQQSVDRAIISTRVVPERGIVALGLNVQRFEISIDGVTVHAICSSCKEEQLFGGKQLYLAAGTIETPAIIIRSGFAKASEFDFAFHAMHRIVAISEEVINDGKDIDPHQSWTADHKFKFGAAVSTVSLLKGILKLVGFERSEGAAIENVATYYVSHASEGRAGLFSLGGKAYPYFFENKKFEVRARQGFEMLASMLRGESLEVPPQKLSTSTVHVFGSIPIGKSHLVDKSGWLRGAENLVRVFDASLLPSHPKVNPQGPLMHLLESLVKKHG